jgi:cell wall-associated NlpC family hydrolase
MRSIWLIFGVLLLALLGLRFWVARPAAESAGPAPAAPTGVVLVAQRVASPRPALAGQRDSIVRLALQQLGTPYTWAGTSPLTGFDCSGFITYVFGRFGVATPHATALLINAGRPVPRAQAQPGDIVVFTGTAEGSTTPGHAGIVISALGETPLRFVHASSARRESGVKVSQVENSGYERRFMQVRRVLGGGPAITSPTLAVASQPVAPRPLAHPAGAVASLPTAPPEVAADLAVTLPTRLAPVPMRLRTHARAGSKVLKSSPKSVAASRRKALAKHPAAKKAAASKVTTKKAAPKKPATRKKTTRPAARPKPTAHRAKPKSH